MIFSANALKFWLYFRLKSYLAISQYLFVNRVKDGN